VHAIITIGNICSIWIMFFSWGWLRWTSRSPEICMVYEEQTTLAIDKRGEQGWEVPSALSLALEFKMSIALSD